MTMLTPREQELSILVQVLMRRLKVRRITVGLSDLEDCRSDVLPSISQDHRGNCEVFIPPRVMTIDGQASEVRP